MWYDANFIFPLGTGPSPDYSETNGRSIAQRAEELGVHPVELVIDRLIASEGRELFNTWFFNRAVDILPEVLSLDHTYPVLPPEPKP